MFTRRRKAFVRASRRPCNPCEVIAQSPQRVPLQRGRSAGQHIGKPLRWKTGLRRRVVCSAGSVWRRFPFSGAYESLKVWSRGVWRRRAHSKLLLRRSSPDGDSLAHVALTRCSMPWRLHNTKGTETETVQYMQTWTHSPTSDPPDRPVLPPPNLQLVHALSRRLPEPARQPRRPSDTRAPPRILLVALCPDLRQPARDERPQAREDVRAFEAHEEGRVRRRVEGCVGRGEGGFGRVREGHLCGRGTQVSRAFLEEERRPRRRTE